MAQGYFPAKTSFKTLRAMESLTFHDLGNFMSSIDLHSHGLSFLEYVQLEWNELTCSIF